jgi:hypothetical protein
MAEPGVKFELTEEQKNMAVAYVKGTGLFKNRLANFLGVSRPTLNRLFEDDPDFFTQVKASDAQFCQNLIEAAAKKNPFFLLRTKYPEEFGERVKIGFDPEEAIQQVKEIIKANTTKAIYHPPIDPNLSLN